jgi:hypothetical protein
MSRTRLILMALLAAFVVSAVVLAPAMAEPKKCATGSTHWVFCYNNNEEMSNQKAEGSGGTAILASTIGGEAKFECDSSTLAAELEASGKGKGTITLHKCKETLPEHCRLTAAEETEIKLPFAETLSSEYKKGVPPEAAFAGTQAGEEIYDLGIEHETSACPIPTGSYAITGKQETELPKAEESLTEHEIVAKKSLSDMKIGGNAASLSATDKVKMSSSHGGSSAWYVGLGN